MNIHLELILAAKFYLNIHVKSFVSMLIFTISEILTKKNFFIECISMLQNGVISVFHRNNITFYLKLFILK